MCGNCSNRTVLSLLACASLWTCTYYVQPCSVHVPRSVQVHAHEHTNVQVCTARVPTPFHHPFLAVLRRGCLICDCWILKAHKNIICLLPSLIYLLYLCNGRLTSELRILICIKLRRLFP